MTVNLKNTDLCREVDEAGRDVDRRKRDRDVNLWLIQLTEDGFQAAHVLHLETSVLNSVNLLNYTLYLFSSGSRTSNYCYHLSAV